MRAGSVDTSLLLTVWDDTVPVGAALQTPPYPLACNGIAASARQLVAAELARGSVRIWSGCAVNATWHWRSPTPGGRSPGTAGTVTTEEKLYRLGTLRPPTGVPGAHRYATGADHAVLVDWVELFFVETFSHQTR